MTGYRVWMLLHLDRPTWFPVSRTFDNRYDAYSFGKQLNTDDDGWKIEEEDDY